MSPFLPSWWRGGRDVIPAFLFNSARAAQRKAIISMSVCLARAQWLYSFHSRGRLRYFICLAGWGLGLQVEVEGSSSLESDSAEFESSLSSSLSLAPWAPYVSDGLELDEEQLKSSLDIAGLPFNTGRGRTLPTSCTRFSNVMVGIKFEYNT